MNRDNRRDNGPRMNNRIFAKSVHVINYDGQNLGVMPTSQALELAQNADLDLVEINSSGDVPIVKIMDYGKYKYEQKKRASEARKNQKNVGLRDIWVKPFIEENDLQIKMKKVFEFLDNGDKVKISVMKKGDKRVLGQGRDAIPALFEHIMEIIGERGTLESKSKADERTKSIIVAPAKK